MTNLRFALALSITSAACAAVGTLPVEPIPMIPANPTCNGAQPLVRYAPYFPARAKQTRQEGWVIVQFDIHPAGTLLNVRVFDASPKGIFEDNAVAAMAKARFAESGGGFQHCYQLIEFTY